MATSEQLLYGVPTWHQVTSVNNNTASTATAAITANWIPSERVMPPDVRVACPEAA